MLDVARRSTVARVRDSALTLRTFAGGPRALDADLRRPPKSSRYRRPQVRKCCTIMGRGEAGLSAAQMLYPLMQCTDVFFLRADVCQLGVDQRKVRRPAYSWQPLVSA